MENLHSLGNSFKEPMLSRRGRLPMRNCGKLTFIMSFPEKLYLQKLSNEQLN